MATHVAAHACAPCRATLSALRSVGGGPSQALSERHGNHSARCPGLLGALGSRTPPRATGGEGHHAACRLPHSVLSPDGARALPRVYVYTFMDSLHDQLVRLRSSEHIFDPWHQQNQARAQPCSRLADLGREPFRRSLFAQFLSEYAFHRSLVASSLVTADPAKASLYFVPFYSRMAFSNRSIRALMLSALEAGLGASPFWRRSRGRDHAFVISSTRPMEQLFGPQANAVTCRYTPLHAVTRRYNGAAFRTAVELHLLSSWHVCSHKGALARISRPGRCGVGGPRGGDSPVHASCAPASSRSSPTPYSSRSSWPTRGTSRALGGPTTSPCHTTCRGSLSTRRVPAVTCRDMP